MAGQPAIHVFTFRRGLLARLGHDLQLHVARFELEVNGSSLTGRFDSGSLRVDGAITRGGVLDADAIGARDRAEIERTIADEILLAARYPAVALDAAVEALGGSRFALRGTLTVRDRTQSIGCAVEPRGDQLVAQLELVPSQFGIAPYRALGGALALEDRVRVVVSVPTEPGAGPLPPRSAWTRGVVPSARGGD
jgi:hypothetical protein